MVMLVVVQDGTTNFQMSRTPSLMFLSQHLRYSHLSVQGVSRVHEGI